MILGCNWILKQILKTAAENETETVSKTWKQNSSNRNWILKTDFENCDQKWNGNCFKDSKTKNLMPSPGLVTWKAEKQKILKKIMLNRKNLYFRKLF